MILLAEIIDHDAGFSLAMPHTLTRLLHHPRTRRPRIDRMLLPHILLIRGPAIVTPSWIQRPHSLQIGLEIIPIGNRPQSCLFRMDEGNQHLKCLQPFLCGLTSLPPMGNTNLHLIMDALPQLQSKTQWCKHLVRRALNPPYQQRLLQRYGTNLTT